jgi:predicted MPP superfamily phosphohydrolase
VRTDETIRVFLFVFVVGAIYAGTLITLLQHAVARLRGRPFAWSRERRVAGVLALLGLPCIAYGFWEPYWLETTRVSIESPKLQGATRPLRIVHLSDLHCDPRPRLEERLPAAVAAERPDLIVFTGDAVNSPGGLPVFRRLMAALAKIAPTYAVRGNWDAWYWPGLDLFGGTGVVELDGVLLGRAAGVRFAVVGLPVGREDELPARLATAPRDAFVLLLHHYPDEILTAQAGGVDLYCAGHTHGGQVALPFYGALVTLSRYGKEYEAGLYLEGDTVLYVNRGIGMEGGPAPRVRFCARPELTVIELRAPAGSD